MPLFHTMLSRDSFCRFMSYPIIYHCTVVGNHLVESLDRCSLLNEFAFNYLLE
jgi:hypothetical protein